MNVLVFSPYTHLIQGTIERAGDRVILVPQQSETIDFIVSFGHRKIMKGDVLKQYKNRIINIHISLLPWNRGADPNFWSWFDDTPKGVSIHYIDAGIDTGPIVAQHQIRSWRRGETLKSSWLQLIASARELFQREWSDIRDGKVVIYQHRETGSFHKFADKEPWTKKMPLGWETPVKDIMSMGADFRSRINLSPGSSDHYGGRELATTG